MSGNSSSLIESSHSTSVLDATNTSRTILQLPIRVSPSTSASSRATQDNRTSTSKDGSIIRVRVSDCRHVACKFECQMLCTPVVNRSLLLSKLSVFMNEAKPLTTLLTAELSSLNHTIPLCPSSVVKAVSMTSSATWISLKQNNQNILVTDYPFERLFLHITRCYKTSITLTSHMHLIAQ